MSRALTGATGRKAQARANVWKVLFLVILGSTCNVGAACQAVGIDRSTASKARARDPEFARRWEEAIEGAIDRLMAAAWRRALAGSDRILVALLRLYGPDRLGELIRAIVETRRLARDLGLSPEDQEKAVAAVIRAIRRRRRWGRRSF